MTFIRDAMLKTCTEEVTQVSYHLIGKRKLSSKRKLYDFHCVQTEVRSESSGLTFTLAKAYRCFFFF